MFLTLGVFAVGVMGEGFFGVDASLGMVLAFCRSTSRLSGVVPIKLLGDVIMDGVCGS